MSKTIDDCWNQRGVQGDRSCEKLREHTHCRNCEVYAAAAREIMQRRLPADYQQEWADHFAVQEQAQQETDQSALVFRIGREWLSLPARMSLTIAETSAPHRIPHRDNKLLAGIVNVKGRLYPCMSLPGLLDIDTAQPPAQPGRRVYPRLLVMQWQQQAFALPVDDLYGIHRYASSDLQSLPTTAEKALHRYVTGILRIHEMHVGCLDTELIGYKFASALK